MLDRGMQRLQQTEANVSARALPGKRLPEYERGNTVLSLTTRADLGPELPLTHSANSPTRPNAIQRLGTCTILGPRIARTPMSSRMVRFRSLRIGQCETARISASLLHLIIFSRIFVESFKAAVQSKRISNPFKWTLLRPLNGTSRARISKLPCPLVILRDVQAITFWRACLAMSRATEIPDHFHVRCLWPIRYLGRRVR